jgi:L-ascorbate metabolism protein UlaG (beta-lactamase superfamily)
MVKLTLYAACVIVNQVIAIMEITWLGHSCFKIKGKQVTIITDPFSADLGYSMGKSTADIVTISHQHSGHSNSAEIGGNPKIISGPGEYEISGVLVIGLDTFHDAEKGQKSGKNTTYVIDLEEITICHLGDLGHTLSSDLLEELGKIDILMVPVGGFSTINATAAAEVVRQIEPRIVLPMHYKTLLSTRELEPVDRFLKEMGVDQIAPQPKLTVTRTNMPETTRVFLLE